MAYERYKSEVSLSKPEKVSLMSEYIDYYKQLIDEQGLDVNKLLPQLSTYMGHNGVASTQRYLHMTPDLLAQASQRFAAYAGQGGHHAQS